MIEKKVNILDLSINIRSRMGFMWFMTFFYQAGFILSWIITTSLFIEFFGIQNLLWLFFLEALLIFIGSVLSHFILKKTEISKVLMWSTALIIMIIFAGFFLGDGESNQIEFLFLAILAKDLLYPRVRIGLLRKTESLFSPSQAEKAIPMIDSALTIGLVVMAAIVLAILEIFPKVATQDILSIWIIPLSVIGLMLFFESKILKKVPHIFHKTDLYENENNSFKDTFADLKKTPFLKFLLLIILLQSTLYTITEFEFIRQLDSHIIENSPKITLNADHLKANIFNDVKEAAEDITNFAINKIEKSSSKIYAHETLLHDLTGLSLVFGLIALIVQFLLTPWVLSKFGIVRAINLYFAGFLFMTFSFVFGGHMPINFVRGYEHSFHSMFMSGYHLSFYSILEKHREFMRHIVEGMITPLGTIIAVLIVAFLNSISAIILMPFMITTIGVIIFILSSFLYKSRTRLAEKNLETAENMAQKMRAIEVLGQSGQHNSHHILSRELKNKNHHDILREKITETLLQVNNLETVHTYVHVLEKEKDNHNLKLRVLEAMLEMDNLKEYSKNRHFMRFKIVNVLQELFEEANSTYLKKLIIMNIFQHLPAEAVVPFFNKIMESEDEVMQSICLRSSMIFNDPDIVTFVEPYLSHSSPRVRSHALISLWKFSEKTFLREVLDTMLMADNHEAKIAGIYAIGEINDKDCLESLYCFSREDNLEVRLHSLVARAKLGDKRCISGIIELLLSADEKVAHKIFNMLKRGVPKKIKEMIKEKIHHEVAHKVDDVIKPFMKKEKIHKDLPIQVVKYLKRLYHFAGKHDDILVLNQYYSS